MKKLTGFVLLFLLLIVIGLSVAVVNLYQNPRMMNETDTSSLPSSSASVAHEENSGTDASSKNESRSENEQEESEVVSLQCSMQLGVLNIVEGDEFHVSESNGSDYEMYIEDGVYNYKRERNPGKPHCRDGSGEFSLSICGINGYWRGFDSARHPCANSVDKL